MERTEIGIHELMKGSIADYPRLPKAIEKGNPCLDSIEASFRRRVQNWITNAARGNNIAKLKTFQYDVRIVQYGFIIPALEPLSKIQAMNKIEMLREANNE
jgi:hypothetical protein